MRGADTFTKSLFTLCQLQDFIPKSHPLRPIRQTVNAALIKMDALFSHMCEDDIKGGRPRPPAVVIAESPRVLVETRRDLRDLKLPFEETKPE